MSEQGQDLDTKREAYDEARTKLADLIDNPERHLPVSEYRAHLTAAQKAVARAYKAMTAAQA